MPTKRTTETDDNSITFRLPPEALASLLRQAKLAGISSKHKFARALVIRALEPSEESDLAQTLAAIEDALTALRRALGLGVGAILQNVSDLEEEAIRAWVFSRLLSDAAEEETPPNSPAPDDHPNHRRNGQ
jgi:hypothetical protein